MEDNYKVPYSEVPLPADIGDGPFFTEMPDPNAAKLSIAKVDVFNNPTENDWVGKILYGKADCSAFIRVSDIVGPNSYKRVVRYLTIHPREDLRDDVLVIAFVGRKNDVNSHLVNSISTPSLLTKAEGAIGTIGRAISLAKPTAENGSMFTIDGNFKIVMAPIQADYTRDFCEADDFVGGRYSPRPDNPQWPIEFLFNNGHQKYIVFNGDVGRNVLISCDIVNPDPINSTMLEFNIYAFQMRKEE